jgi:hypothetical protein
MEPAAPRGHSPCHQQEQQTATAAFGRVEALLPRRE